MDKREGSEWHPVVDEHGKVNTLEPVAHGWKTPYHTGRMCVEMVERLKT